jgi:hypothetical protein
MTGSPRPAGAFVVSGAGRNQVLPLQKEPGAAPDDQGVAAVLRRSHATPGREPPRRPCLGGGASRGPGIAELSASCPRPAPRWSGLHRRGLRQPSREFGESLERVRDGHSGVAPPGPAAFLPERTERGVAAHGPPTPAWNRGRRVVSEEVPGEAPTPGIGPSSTPHHPPVPRRGRTLLPIRPEGAPGILACRETSRPER